jgi:hypothetical protein
MQSHVLPLAAYFTVRLAPPGLEFGESKYLNRRPHASRYNVTAASLGEVLQECRTQPEDRGIIGHFQPPPGPLFGIGVWRRDIKRGFTTTGVFSAQGRDRNVTARHDLPPISAALGAYNFIIGHSQGNGV